MLIYLKGGLNQSGRLQTVDDKFRPTTELQIFGYLWLVILKTIMAEFLQSGCIIKVDGIIVIKVSNG